MNSHCETDLIELLMSAFVICSIKISSQTGRLHVKSRSPRLLKNGRSGNTRLTFFHKNNQPEMNGCCPLQRGLAVSRPCCYYPGLLQAETNVHCLLSSCYLLGPVKAPEGLSLGGEPSVPQVLHEALSPFSSLTLLVLMCPVFQC